jgi:hypothetical protein
MLKMDSIHVLMLGTSLERCTRQLDGGNWSGFHPLSLNIFFFFLWLVFRNALVTKERMCGWGYTGCTLCLFCRAAQENREHLFFRCSFSSRIWTNIMSECSIPNAPLDWDAIEAWGLKVLRGRGVRANFGEAVFGIYCV